MKNALTILAAANSLCDDGFLTLVDERCDEITYCVNFSAVIQAARFIKLLSN